MASKRNAFAGAVVPISGPNGETQWQSWTYGELTQHLTNDLSLDDFTPPSSLAWTPIWTPPGLINGWANLGVGTVGAGYLKDPLGFIHLRGRITGGANATVAFTLPIGFRLEEANDTYAAAGFNGATAVAAFVNIFNYGDVTVYFAAGATDVGLGGISFLGAR